MVDPLDMSDLAKVHYTMKQVVREAIVGEYEGVWLAGWRQWGGGLMTSSCTLFCSWDQVCSAV